ncbi:MAG: DNA-protecting protein DprA [Clostridiales bacterium]|nr:DNA-protecting protein DprA [Clostridiales bacterium]
MDQSSDAMNLAMAIHLTQCQRTLNLRHAELRKLTDQCPDLTRLMQMDLDGLIGLLTGKDSNREETFAKDHMRIEAQALTLHQVLQDTSSQRSAITLARQCAHLAIKPVLSGDPQFPKALHELNTCPALLYVRGSLLPDMLRCFPWVTVIGTRRPTVYGQKVTRKITRGLCQGGAVIVSGLARGIDTLAHQTALKTRGLQSE